jgi:hypothetical protein
VQQRRHDTTEKEVEPVAWRHRRSEPEERTVLPHPRVSEANARSIARNEVTIRLYGHPDELNLPDLLHRKAADQHRFRAPSLSTYLVSAW